MQSHRVAERIPSRIGTTSHTWLIEHMQKAYHLKTGDLEGLCFGMVVLGMQAALASEEALADFERRFANLAHEAKAEHMYPDTKPFYQHASVAFYNNRAFLERMIIYSSADHDTQLCGTTHVFSQPKILPHAQPLLLSDLLRQDHFDNPSDCIHEPLAFSGAYSNDDLANFLEALRDAANKTKTGKQPVCFMLVLEKHAVNLLYHPKYQTWGIMDIATKAINDKNEPIYPTLYFDTMEYAVDCLWDMLSNRNATPYVSFHTRCFAKKSALTDMNAIFDHFQADPRVQACRLITPEKLKQIDSEANTLLTMAAYQGDTRCLSQAVHSGANMNITNRDGDTPLILAASSGQTAIVQALCNTPGIDIDFHHKDNRYTALSRAIMCGWYDCVDILIQHGADVNTIAENNMSMLSIAANFNRDTIIDLLLAHGAKIDASGTNEAHKPRLREALEKQHTPPRRRCHLL